MKVKLLFILLVGLQTKLNAQVVHDYKQGCCKLVGAINSIESCYCAGCADTAKKNKEAKDAEDKRVKELSIKKAEKQRQAAIEKQKKENEAVAQKNKDAKANTLHYGFGNSKIAEGKTDKSSLKETGVWISKVKPGPILGFVDSSLKDVDWKDISESDWKIMPNSRFGTYYGVSTRYSEFDKDRKYALVSESNTHAYIKPTCGGCEEGNFATLVINRKGEIVNQCSNRDKFILLKEPFALKFFEVESENLYLHACRASLINIENNVEYKQLSNNWSSEYCMNDGFWTDGVFEINLKEAFVYGRYEFNTNFIDVVRKELATGYHTLIGYRERSNFTYLLIKKDGTYKEMNNVPYETIFKK